MNKEIKIGFIAISTVFVLFVGINYLKGLNVLNSQRVYYAQYNDIGGLQIGSPVMVNGYQVGMVSDIKLLMNDNKDLLVEISLDHEFDMADNTVCKIVNKDLMGTKGVDLVLGNSLNYLSIGDTLISGIEGSLQEEVNAQILPLKNKAEELIGSVDSVMTIVTAVLNKNTRENLKNSLRSLDRTFLLMSKTMVKVDNMVDLNDDRISSIIKNLESISNHLEGSNSEIETILRNFASISDSLAEADIAVTIKNIGNLSTRINNGEGSLGLFMQDDKIYKNLEKSTRELADLLQDIKVNPSRYVNFSIIGGSSRYVQPEKDN